MNKGAFKLYREEREKGLTYREIAEKYGVSYQGVAQACGKSNPNYFKYHKENAVIYPNLRKWMNDNKVSIFEMVRRCGMERCNDNAIRLRNQLKGKNHFRKPMIDKLIAITGMKYEELFKE